MPTPQFILDLRAHVGHDPLWLSGITAVVVEDGLILLNRRSDNGRWSLLHGIVEPGEQPADTVVREVLEETGVTVRPERITSVHTLPAFACANGDQVQYLDIAFRCRPIGGEARVNDEESLAVEWFPLDALPELSHNDAMLLEKALADAPSPWFALG
ncbi:NUDIX domain-containing protein [Streptomyces sp. TLI_171]|uniref:NUDIX hydrolase n=1 Tax=Streptomyces sp. TLI_171 TaxID=1938859 RepID=UPI000C1A4DDF|nr:NUDIX domain-containing protein [Streptomyces sp. TLI_171]RKE17697.1 ADP-ribose pyrophosphatase YjhB (NUDIX family) [Streptomyces sp. TLI_171]